jgi:DNA-binding GntR family transcriptional regulator
MPDMQNGFRTLKSMVYEALREEILTGATPPGTRLVRRSLSKRLGVSPIPVIEALHQLEQDGLVESEPMFGHRVRLISGEAVQNDHIMREAIECQAARLCAQCATEEQVQDLARKAEALDRVLECEHDGTVHSEEHFQFHLDIARVSGVSALVKALENLWFRRLMVINTSNAKTLGLPKNWHSLLVKAIGSHDPDIAEKTMRQHVQYNVAEQLKQLNANKSKSKPGEPRQVGLASSRSRPKSTVAARA